MKKLYFLLIIIISLSSCKSVQNKSQRKKTTTSKTTKVVTKKPKPSEKSISNTAKAIIKEAKSYKGTKYKYGGNSKRGIDCSGLIYNAFGENGVVMPRTTRDLSKTGDWVDIKKVQEGDLVFFATNKNSRRVNHVGIVTDVNLGEISFIHASSSRGVMISKTSERYWYLAYVQARRYL
jgi:cell wall-associated NlpC family hydrolase